MNGKERTERNIEVLRTIEPLMGQLRDLLYDAICRYGSPDKADIQFTAMLRDFWKQLRETQISTAVRLVELEEAILTVRHNTGVSSREGHTFPGQKDTCTGKEES